MPTVVLTPTTSGVPLSDLIRRTRLFLEDYPQKDQTSNVGPITAATNPFYVLDPTMWGTGVRGEFDDGTLEQFLVRSVNLPASSLTVQRGAYGSTASEHDPSTYLLREPRFGAQMIFDALSAATTWLNDWCWVPVQATLTPSQSTSYYEVPDDFIGWVSLTQASSDARSLTNYGVRHSHLPVKINRNVPDTVSSTGIALWIPIVAHTNTDMLLTYGAAITADTIPEGSTAEAIINGACAILLGAKDVPRTGQDISQGGGTVPTGATIQTASWFLNQFVQYRSQARVDLDASGPLHRN